MTTRKPPMPKARSKRVKLTGPKTPRDDRDGMLYDPRQGLLFPADSQEGRACEWGFQFNDDPQTETRLFKNYALLFERGRPFLARMEWRGYVCKDEALRQGRRLREIVRTDVEMHLLEEGRMIEAWVFARGTWKLCAEKKDDGTFTDYGTHPETP